MKRYFVSLLISFTIIMITGAQTDTTTLVNTGDKPPLFRCTAIDGKVFDLSRMEGKVVLINFFATWCPPCNLELPALQKNIWDIYKSDPDFVLIILGREHTDKEVTDYVRSKGYTMPFAADPGREVYKLFATQYIPRNVLIGKDGRVIFQNRGYTPEEFKKIEELIAEQLGSQQSKKQRE